jgi:large subunit ribosomal protein L35
VRGVRLLPKRLWKRKPGLGLKGGQKLKAHSGAKKRFKVSANGKVLVMPAGKQHLNYGTSGRKRQKLRKWRVLHSTQAKTIRMLMLQNGRLLHPYYKPKAKLELRSQPLSDSELKEALS